MKKSIIFGLLFVALIGLVSAHGGQGSNVGAMSSEIIEDGTYQDLVEFRQEAGFNVMPMIDSEAEFNEAKERHEIMEKSHQEHGNMRMGRMGCHRS